MKRWSVAVLVVALTLAAVPLAAAGTGNGGGTAKGKSNFNLVGKMVAVGAAAGSLTVRAKTGTKTVKAFRAADLVLVVDPAARVRRVTADGRVAAVLGDVPVGAKVKVRGRIERIDPAAPAYVALCVKARAPVSPEPAQERRRPAPPLFFSPRPVPRARLANAPSVRIAFRHAGWEAARFRLRAIDFVPGRPRASPAVKDVLADLRMLL